MNHRPLAESEERFEERLEALEPERIPKKEENRHNKAAS